jgi:hypothetical protein
VADVRFMGSIYVWRDGGFYEKFTGERMVVPSRDEISVPAVLSDIPEYTSPIDGRLITSRSHRREDLKRNNCVEWEPSMSPTKGKFRNERFCKKYGLEVSEEFRK